MITLKILFRICNVIFYVHVFIVILYDFTVFRLQIKPQFQLSEIKSIIKIVVIVSNEIHILID